MKLYKYCSFSSNSLSILIDRKIWYAKPTDFNDPFDGDFEMDDSCSINDFIKLFSKQNKDTFDHVESEYSNGNGFIKEDVLAEHQKILGVFKNIGVLCLTSRKDSTLMWSHYADMHYGFCIQFDIADDKPISMINYAEKPPKHNLSYYFSNRTDKNGYIDIEFTKHLDWAYEDEYRISINAGNRLVDVPGKIKEIHFGCKMSNQNKETIARLVNMSHEGENIKLFSAVKADWLNLEFEPFFNQNLIG